MHTHHPARGDTPAETTAIVASANFRAFSNAIEGGREAPTAAAAAVAAARMIGMIVCDSNKNKRSHANTSAASVRRRRPVARGGGEFERVARNRSTEFLKDTFGRDVHFLEFVLFTWQ
jgi:hypothetical protein